MKKNLVKLVSFSAAVFLLAGCMSTPHAYKGGKLSENELSMLCSAGTGGTLTITGVNDRDVNPFIGGALTAYVKPGENKVRFFFTTTDYSTNIETTVKWEVRFNCDKNHTYVFYPIHTDEDKYLIAGYDMGTDYVYDFNKPLGMIQIEAKNNGSAVELHK